MSEIIANICCLCISLQLVCWNCQVSHALHTAARQHRYCCRYSRSPATVRSSRKGHTWCLAGKVTWTPYCLADKQLTDPVCCCREGFAQVFSLGALACFAEDELEAMLCGTGEKWTVEKLAETIKCDHG